MSKQTSKQNKNKQNNKQNKKPNKKRPVNKTRPLTRKQKAFVQTMIDNPKMSATQVALRTYDTDYNTARSIASENLAKPAIRSELAKHSKSIEDTLANNFYRLATSEELEEIREGNRVGMYIHDKIHGKATQKTEVKQSSISINIDLTLDDDS